MKGKRVVLTAVVLLILLAAIPAVAVGARGGGGGGREVATALGTIVSIDYEAESFVIDVVKSNGLVDQDPLTVLTTEATHIKECINGVSVPIDFDDLAVGDWVRLDGTVDASGNLVARRITKNPINAIP